MARIARVGGKEGFGCETSGLFNFWFLSCHMGFGFSCVSFILSFGKVRLVVTRRLGFMCVYA